MLFGTASCSFSAEHDEYEESRAKPCLQANRPVTPRPHRGYRWKPLAQNEPMRKVVADATLITNRAAVAELLATSLKMPIEQVTEKLDREVYSKAQEKESPGSITSS